MGVASVYRSLELPLPKQLPYASKDIRRRWSDLLARIMPFDLVIDEHTADGQEARVTLGPGEVSKSLVIGGFGLSVPSNATHPRTAPAPSITSARCRLMNALVDERAV